MKETPKQYTKRILGYLEGKKPLAVQSATAGKLARLVRGLSRAQLRRRPAPGKWSIAEILAHLADVEIAVGWRLRQILSTNRVPIQAFDQDAWARAGNYARQDPRRSLADFQVVRRKNLELLRSVPERLWANYGMHQERGKETVARMVEMIAGHDLNHLGQIERIARSLRSRNK